MSEWHSAPGRPLHFLYQLKRSPFLARTVKSFYTHVTYAVTPNRSKRDSRLGFFITREAKVVGIQSLQPPSREKVGIPTPHLGIPSGHKASLRHLAPTPAVQPQLP